MQLSLRNKRLPHAPKAYGVSSFILYQDGHVLVNPYIYLDKILYHHIMISNILISYIPLSYIMIIHLSVKSLLQSPVCVMECNILKHDSYWLPGLQYPKSQNWVMGKNQETHRETLCKVAVLLTHPRSVSPFEMAIEGKNGTNIHLG